MANSEHLEMLHQGVTQWNTWREEHPEIRPNLNDVDLRELDLSFANLHSANLSFTNLTGTSLRRACLASANLWHTNLNGANLRNTDLSVTLFQDTKLHQTQFHHALLSRTTFVDVNLSTAQGLETVRHMAPSHIGIDTIYHSQGKVSERFLRGAGVPEPFIIQMSTLVAAMRPIDFYSCFLSYSRHDQDFARRLYADLQAQGVRCWFAPEDLKIGDHYHQRIDESIRCYDKLILILSRHAIASAWVEREFVAVREKEDTEHRSVLFPLRLDEEIMHTQRAWAADIRRRWHIGDFTQWKHQDAYQSSFQRLLKDLHTSTISDM